MRKLKRGNGYLMQSWCRADGWQHDFGMSMVNAQQLPQAEPPIAVNADATYAASGIAV